MTTAIIQGKLHKAMVTTFKDDDGNDQTWARIQLLVPDRSEVFDQIQNIKVSKDKFGWIPDFQLFLGVDVNVACDISEYKGKVSFNLDNHFLAANKHLTDEHKKRQAALDAKAKAAA